MNIKEITKYLSFKKPDDENSVIPDELKQKYRMEYTVEQMNNIRKINYYITVVSIIILLLMLKIDVYFQPQDIRLQVLITRLFALITYALVFIVQFFRIGLCQNILNFLIVLAPLEMQSHYVLLYNGAYERTSMCLLLIIIFCGLYPVSVIVSLMAFIITIIQVTAEQILIAGIEHTDKHFLIFIANTIITFFLVSVFKYVTRLKDEKEYFSKIQIKEANREISELNEKLRDLDRIKSDFFANISHEIRTPLTLMVTPVEAVLQDEYQGKIDKNFFQSIYRNGLRLLELINNLLDFSKIDAESCILKVAENDLAGFIKTYSESVRSVFELKRIELNVAVEAGVPPVFFDREKMERVVANLLSNSMKFTDTGGSVTVSVKRTSESGLEYLVAEFADTGPGIPRDRTGIIFDRFSQADSSSTRKYEGTGIGLALVKEYITMHGGTISAESRHESEYPGDHGSVFAIKIPVGVKHLVNRNDVEFVNSIVASDCKNIFNGKLADIGMTTDKVETGSDINHHPYHPDEMTYTRIMVVEDNPDMHRMLNDILQKEYRTINAIDGFDSLRLLDSEENLPDLILSDVMMPGMDGYELTRHIRRDRRFDGIPVILLTAKAGLDMTIEGFDVGASDYIIKPFNTRELMARIKSQLDLKQLRDKLARTNKQLYARLESAGSGHNSVSVSAEQKVKKVIDFINENFTADISREGMAAAVEINADHLSRMFNRVTGKRIDSYINELRIEKSKLELANTDKPVITIAMDSGFETLRTFNRLFKDTVGLTPKEYRLRNTEKCIV